MPFAIGLLSVLAIACALSSLVTQGQAYNWYVSKYGERTAAVIIALHADDAYHSGWFLALTGFLCLNLIGCSLVRLPGLIRRFRHMGDPDAMGEPTATEEGINKPESVFEALRMPAPTARKNGEGREELYSAKNRIGLWGAWICHIGILMLILGFALGQWTGKQETVYGVPGQTKPLGDTGLAVTIRDFAVSLREDDTVEQYTADITVTEQDTGRSEDARISVNNPAKRFGWTFYQNSTGYASRVRVLKDGKDLQEEILCVGESLAVADKPDLIIHFQAFYPDYVMADSGPATRSGQMNHPAWLYLVAYQGQVLGMNALMEGEELTIDEYTVLFDQPRNYTLISAKRDLFTPLALAGGLVTMLGLMLALYVRPASLKAVKDGEAWTVYGRCEKGGVLFAEALRDAADAERKGKPEGKGEQGT